MERLGVLAAGAATMLALAGCPPIPTPSPVYKPTDRIVFPTVATGPTIDGLANDPAWTSGFLYVMEHGGSFPAASLRGVADANAIYIYANVQDDGFEATDVLVIGINPDNASNDYRRIHVFPCNPTGSCPASGPGHPLVQYDSGGFAGGAYTWVSKGDGSGAGIVAQSATSASPQSWSVELKIPRTVPFPFVTTNFFGLFVDVVRTNPAAGVAGTAVQYTWPPNQFIGATSENDVLADLETGTLAPSDWGNATLSASFGNGVSVFSNELGSDDPSDPNHIRITNPNIFHAVATNFSSTAGTLVTAHAVKATFTIANNGLPGLGSWANVPVDLNAPNPNPTAERDIAPAADSTYLIGPWTLTMAQQGDYTAHPYQCVRVTHSSSKLNTIFVNPTAMRNMQFVTTGSPFRDRPTVSTKGLEFSGDSLEFTLREQFVNFDPQLPWTSEIGNAKPVREHVYRTSVKRNSDQVLDIMVDPPKVAIPSVALRVLPGTGGQARPPLRVDVEPDQLITFVSSGTLMIDGQSVSAAGAPLHGRRHEGASKGFDPQLTGALVGSFDGFKESAFLIGNATTIKVPQGTRQLQVKINDDADQYEKQRGEGFDVQVVRTRIEPWMLQANPDLGRSVRGADVLVTLGANLPTWMLRGERDTGRYIRIGKKTFRVFESVGTFGYIVRKIQ